ncbi:hypothetical protein LTR24_008443 [Lithohypha guttulata]|uniref:Uncharacterized protein n=1 Tax=Lithohypha guttulata TaxID=1690604 RepID=A0ABR0K025_9EURO|nr:hypothetical protein LTR24_008443 [Lithohypha guttulata]
MTAQRDFLYLADDGSLPAPSTQSLVYSDFAGATTHIVRVSRALQNMSRDDPIRHHRLGRQCLEGADGVDSGDKPSLTSVDSARIACQTPLPLISSDTSDSGSIIKMLSDEIRSVVDREARLRSDPVPVAEQTVFNRQVPTLPQQAAAGVSKCPGPPPLKPLPPLPRPQDVLERPQAKKQSTASTRSSMPYHMASQVGTRLTPSAAIRPYAGSNQDTEHTQDGRDQSTDADTSTHTDNCAVERVVSCWDPLPRHLRLDPRIAGQPTWYPSESPLPKASTRHPNLAFATYQHELLPKDGSEPATAPQSDPLRLLDRTRYQSDKQSVSALGVSGVVNDSESALLMETAPSCDSPARCESVCSSGEGDHDCVLYLEPPSLTFTTTSESASSSTADNLMSRALQSSTLFGLDVSTSSRSYQRTNHRTLNEQNNMLGQQRCERRPEKDQSYATAAEADLNTGELELFPHDTSRFMIPGEGQDLEAGSGTSDRASLYLGPYSDEQELSGNDEFHLSNSSHVRSSRLDRVQWAGAVFRRPAATLECDDDSGHAGADEGIVDAQLVADDEFPSQETYDHALKRGGREWRRKREEEKAVARTIFKLPSDWNDAAKMKEFLVQSRRIWQ